MNFCLLFLVCMSFSISHTDTELDAKCSDTSIPCFIQENENDEASMIVMSYPFFGSWMGTFHPAGALHEGPTNIHLAKKEMEDFQKKVKTMNPKIEIHDVATILRGMDIEKLINLAMDAMVYEFQSSDDHIEDGYLLSDETKRSNLEVMSPEDLVNVLLLRPTVKLSKSEKNTPMQINEVTFSPLMNLLFTRDQQVITSKGLVLGNLNSPQRNPEPKIMKIVWEELGVPVKTLPEENMFLEGGDYFSFSKSLSMVGVGLRTTYNSIHYMMENDYFGTEFVAVVVDKTDMNQDRMHLDTIFNIASPKLVVLHEGVYSGKYERKVELYQKIDGAYVLQKADIDFKDYLENDLGLKVVPIKEKDQLEYMINFLNLGEEIGIIAVNPGLEKVLEGNGLKIEYAPYKHVTQMYGAAHCTTQVFRGWKDI